MSRTDKVLQVAIFVLSFTAIWLLNVPTPWARWAPVVGLASQPFWLVATYRANQPGMFLLAIVYCVPWTLGIINNFNLF